MKDLAGNSVNIITTIAAGNYTIFGMILLQDPNGVAVRLIEKNCMNRGAGAEGISQAILQEWLTSGEQVSRTYQYLIECLRQSDFDALADLIAARTGVADTYMYMHSLVYDKVKVAVYWLTSLVPRPNFSRTQRTRPSFRLLR